MSANTALLEQVARQVAGTASLVEHLGTGGFASTFKVTAGQDVYALKVVDAAISEPERVERELAALARVSHPNVVGYRGNGVVNVGAVPYRWLSMDYVPGPSLRQALETGRRFTLVEAVALVRDAVAGAAALWAAGTAHRDLSPNNLLLTGDGRLVIVDLGLARSLEDETITLLPTPGTPGWMSPEQVGADPTHGDWRSDQFVIGLVAYLLVTGVPALRGRSLLERWQAPDRQRPRPPRELNPEVPPALSDVIDRMLAKAPHRRFLQVDVLVAELDRVAAGLAIGSGSSASLAPAFFLAMGTLKTYATTGDFVAHLAPDGVIVDARARARTSELMDLGTQAHAERLIDPVTYLSRSPLQARPAYYQDLAWGGGPAMTGFADEAARRSWCDTVVKAQLEHEPDTVMAPYFYAGVGELSWVRESLACAATTATLLGDGYGGSGASATASLSGPLPVWTTVAVSASWLSSQAARDQLLTVLTGQHIQTLHLLVHTTQPAFGPLAEPEVLSGFVDVLAVMREAGVPVVAGRRASCGLLLMSLGAAGWTVGISGVQQNMDPHPDSEESSGGPGYDRVYVPGLLNAVTTETFQLFRASHSGHMVLTTPDGADLLDLNPTLENLTTAQRQLLGRHNMIAMRDQVSQLSAVTAAGRVSLMRDWVTTAREIYRQLPTSRMAAESSTFLDAWLRLL